VHASTSHGNLFGGRGGETSQNPTKPKASVGSFSAADLEAKRALAARLKERQQLVAEKARKMLIKKALKSGVEREKIPRLLLLAGRIGVSSPSDVGKMDSVIRDVLGGERAEDEPSSQADAGDYSRVIRGQKTRLVPMRPGQVISILSSLGVRVLSRRGKGSHRLLKNLANGKAAPIIYHPGVDMNPSEINTILKQLEIDKTKFLNAFYNK